MAPSMGTVGHIYIPRTGEVARSLSLPESSSPVHQWSHPLSKLQHRYTQLDPDTLTPSHKCAQMLINWLSSVQFSCSVMSDSVTPWIAARQASLSITNSRSSLRLMSIEKVMSSSHLILCRPLSSCPPSLPASESFPMSQLFAWGGQSIGVAPSKEYPELISFRMDWLDLLAIQGTLKSLLQHHSSKASILWRSAFFTVQLSHPYMTFGKSTALTRGTFVGKCNVSAFWYAIEVGHNFPSKE